jgi:hypothetical protein
MVNRSKALEERPANPWGFFNGWGSLTDLNPTSILTWLSTLFLRGQGFRFLQKLWQETLLELNTSLSELHPGHDVKVQQ